MTEAILFGHYNWRLVALSIAIAWTASYAALDLTARTAQSAGRSRTLWLIGGAFAMGIGIWAMHYIGMLAFQLPVPVLYDVPVVLLSFFAAVVASWVALFVVSRPKPRPLSLIAGSFAMGSGIAVMHYSGMAAMRLSAHLIYNPTIVAVSVGIAVAVSYVALRISIRLLNPTGNPPWIRLAAAGVMGLAIAAMHYVGMAAVCFHHAHVAAPGDQAVSVSSLGIIGITAVTFAVLALSLVGALADRIFSRQRDSLLAEQERWRLIISANQDGLFDANLLTGAVYFSPRWAEILGYRDDELAPHATTWINLLHPDKKADVEAFLAAYVQKKQGILQMEYRLRHKDGSWRWMVCRAQAVWNPDGIATRLVGSHSDVTQQKQAVAKLQASEARFSAFMRNNPVITCIKDADGRMVYTNPTLERTFNLHPGEWLGKTDHELWPAELADRIRHTDLQVIASGHAQELKSATLTPDGVIRQFSTTRFSFASADGAQELGIVAIDVTERVENEKQLRDSEARYRELFEHNPLPSWIYRTADLQILDANEAAVSHFGWSHSEFTAMTVARLRMPGEAQAIEAEVRECVRQHRRTKPLRYRRNQRSDIWVELSIHEIELAGSPARLIAANDISARIEAETQLQFAHDEMERLVAQRTTELQSSEANWRELVEALPQFVWSTTPAGACDFMSRQWAEYTGVPAPQLLGFGWLNTLHPVDLERVKARNSAAHSKFEAFEVEYRIRAKDGSYRWFVSRGRPVRSEAGGPVTQWLGTATDIEDQKRSEERLEAAVAERTLALAEARDRAECAARAKSSFLAAMSHEIRTPMNGIIGMTSLVLETSLTSEQRCYLDTVRSCSEALLGIINDVLDFSKIEAGKMQLENVEFDLQTVLEESLELVTPLAIKKGIEVSLAVGSDVPVTILADPGRLRQVLLNLLSNAIKFTEHGSVHISVSTEAAQDNLATLRVAVRDTGIGITPEQQLGLFQAFSQADRSTTRRFGGTGLGLSIAKRLIDIMGGKIGVSSRVGEGTTFWFNICVPLGTSPQSDALPANVVIVAAAGPLRSKVKSYLERAGIRPLESSSLEALHSPRRADEHGFTGIVSLIIIDSATMHSPLDVESLRTLARFNQAAVLILGTPQDWSGPHQTLADHAVAYLPKPVRCLPLLNAIQSSIRGDFSTPAGDEIKAQPVNLQGSTILLVEDNMVNRKIAKLMLEKLGCQVEIAVNGQEACLRMQARSYDLVLMDCQMPVMDGFQATRTIRNQESGSHRTPIIALTAGVLKEERDQCYSAGMDDFLSKPIAKQDLEAALLRWLSNVPSAKS